MLAPFLHMTPPPGLHVHGHICKNMYARILLTKRAVPVVGRSRGSWRSLHVVIFNRPCRCSNEPRYSPVLLGLLLMHPLAASTLGSLHSRGGLLKAPVLLAVTHVNLSVRSHLVLQWLQPAVYV